MAGWIQEVTGNSMMNTVKNWRGEGACHKTKQIGDNGSHQLCPIKNLQNCVDSMMVAPVDAGHASGQGLTQGQVDRQGLLSRQAKSNVIQPLRLVAWLDPINNGRLVRESIASWDRARLWASLRRHQKQQHSHRQATAT